MFLLGIHVNIHSRLTVSPLHLILNPNHHRFTFHVPEENVLDQKEIEIEGTWLQNVKRRIISRELWIARQWMKIVKHDFWDFFMGMTKDEVHFTQHFTHQRKLDTWNQNEEMYWRCLEHFILLKIETENILLHHIVTKRVVKNEKTVWDKFVTERDVFVSSETFLKVVHSTPLFFKQLPSLWRGVTA